MQTRRLIEAEIPFLRRAARRWQRNAADADDLLQETLLRALASAHLWQPGTNLQAWLSTIMRNEFFTALMRAERHNPADAAADPLVCQYAVSTEVRLVLRDVARALQRLPERQRAAVLLVGVEGKSYSETADTMELSVDAVRCHLARARDQLRAAVYQIKEHSPLRRRDADLPASRQRRAASPAARHRAAMPVTAGAD